MLGDMLTGMMRLLPAELAHRLTVAALSLDRVARTPTADDPRLANRLWGKDFANPIGLAAGFDKNAQTMNAMLRFGFGFVEVGTITPQPQAGNPRPRLFRLPQDRAVINRMGFNNAGMAVAEQNLAAFRARDHQALIGVNIGKNKNTAEAKDDYALLAKGLHPYASYLVINVSSPNTPGLRALQSRAALEELVLACDEAMDGAAVAGSKPPLLVKVAPDLLPADIDDLVQVLAMDQVAGMIISNTTVARPDDLLCEGRAREAGGLSGRPLFAAATRMLATIYRASGGMKPLVGVGGVASGKQAYEKLRQGASLVQLYTGLVYEGPGLIRHIKRDLLALMERDGFATVAEVIGAAHR